MDLQYILILISILLAAMLGLLIWVIRLTLNKKESLITVKSNLTQEPLIKKRTPTQPKKYRHSKLKTAAKERYLAKIITCLEKEKIYRQPDLSLNQIANKLNIPKPYLSQVINEKMNCSFLEFINRYRIEEAKEHLVAPDLAGYTLVEIGKLVGFKAKSTFYATFKKYTGSTPGDYRKNAIMNNIKQFNQ